jgi:serine/threonine protein kinase
MCVRCTIWKKGRRLPASAWSTHEGKDLKKVIWEKEKLPAEEAVGIAQQVCEGLVEAHRLGVVHRELKPQNIMIEKEGQAKIMDFGIAQSVEAPGVTQTGVIIGTPDYISPEQAEGQEADERADIYSLGVIMYEMVTGSVPFRGDTALSVALKHKAQERYDEITRLTSGRLQWGDLYAKSFYMLGKIAEQRGWPGKAIEHYEKFLEVWKDADLDIPEIEDSKNRVLSLRSN